ncbi:hypothetical protein BT93_E2268 [Corymbia citriodora subsp. variegata]|nr:hypothetical protein BT93_E2268 [Corymbia citriodora subsp. variegata]
MAAYSGAWALSARVVAASVAVLAVVLALKLAAPSVAELARVQIPLLWLSLLSWLEPPYIYLVINGIIFTIAASSRLHSNLHEAEAEEARVVSAVNSSHGGGGGGVFDLPPDGKVCFSPRKDVVYQESVVAGFSEAEHAEGSVPEGRDGRGDRVEEEEEFVISRSAWTPTAKRTSSPEVPAERLSAPEKPLVSSRFVHRRPSKASPEGTLSARFKSNSK